jgi:hypothetical protein
MRPLIFALALLAQAPRLAAPSPQAPRARRAAPIPAAAVPNPLPAPAAPTAADALSLMQSLGKPVVDISRLGALPGPGAAARSTRKALQSALDAFRTPNLIPGPIPGVMLPGLPPGKPTIYIPTGNYQVDRWVSPPAATSGVTITGEGGSSSISPWGGGHSPLLIGLPFTPAPNRRSMDSGQFFPLDGTMDSTVKGRFGYRTCPVVPAGSPPVSGFATAWDTPLDLGPVKGWGTVGSLTVEFCVDTDRTPIGRAHVAGMSRGPVAGPWIVIGAPGRIDLLYELDGLPVYDAKGVRRSRQLSIPYKDGGGRRRVAFQLDLAAGSTSAWLDGLRVATTGDPPPPAGSKLADNLDLPFHLGASGASGVKRSDYFQGNPTTDLAVCGFRVSTAARYVDSTPAGQPIARLDGKPVTDALSYFTSDPDTLGFLNVTDDVEDLASCRFIPFRGASAQTFACYAMDPDHGNNASTIGPVQLQGVALRTGGVGSALTIHAAMDARISGCFLEGARGIGTPSGLVNYTTRISDTTLNGSVGGARFYAGAAILDAPRFERVGRDGCLSSRGGTITVRDCPLNGAAYAAGCTPRTFFRIAGGSLVASNVGIDNEENTSPTVATFWATATYGDSTSQPAFLKLDQSGSHTHPGIPLVRLDRESPLARLATARITDPLMSIADAAVCTFGGWNVRLDDPGDRRGMPGVLDLSAPGPPAPGQVVGAVSAAGAK